MELELPHKRERGQVGIGTLIVFIAMVLVAAIAAGVLINTAGFLQSQSEETGESASESTTNRLQVVQAVGEDLSDSEVDTVAITVKQAPGSSNIDLGATFIQWTGNSGSYDLTHTSRSGTPEFSTTEIQDDDDSVTSSPPVLNDESDRAKITIDVSDLRGADNGLPEGSTAEILLNSQPGGTTEFILNVPPTLSGTSAVNL
jgi:flagellin-like protein